MCHDCTNIQISHRPFSCVPFIFVDSNADIVSSPSPGRPHSYLSFEFHRCYQGKKSAVIGPESLPLPPLLLPRLPRLAVLAASAAGGEALRGADPLGTGRWWAEIKFEQFWWLAYPRSGLFISGRASQRREWFKFDIFVFEIYAVRCRAHAVNLRINNIHYECVSRSILHSNHMVF